MEAGRCWPAGHDDDGRPRLKKKKTGYPQDII